MSEEDINLGLSLGTSSYSQPPSLQQPVQESRNSLQRPSPAPQESVHGAQTQLPSPTVQESPSGGQLQVVYRPRPLYRVLPLPVLESLYGVQESVHRPHREFEFIPPAGQESVNYRRHRQSQFHSPAPQESVHGGQTQLSSPTFQESPHGGPLQFVRPAVQDFVFRPRPRHQSVPLAVLESLYGGQSQPLSPAVQESVNYRGQLRHEESVRGYNFPSQLQHLSVPEAVQFFKHSLSQGLPQMVQSVIQSPSLDVSSLLPPPPQETQPEQEITTIHPWEISPAKLHTLVYIRSKNINMVSGEMMCTRCKTRESLEYNIEEKFKDVREYMNENVKQLRGKASTVMLKADQLGKCGKCGTVRLRPLISEKDEEINWLFLILGQMLGSCDIDQLKYFCEKNSLAKSFNKDRLLYTAYVVICKQLDPALPFEL